MPERNKVAWGVWKTASPEELQSLAERLGRTAQWGDVWALVGPLGVGKTCFAQGFARGLDITVPVLSPSFVLVREYRGRLPLFHVDVYRLETVEEALAIGLEEYLPGPGVTIVEWAEKIEALLPPEHIRVDLAFANAGREVRITLPPNRREALLP
ncbi:MAG TPA: tRNA (adenosine(37)-N6)-threonylcarbamoyltransferase complex ATPase subunit type 1 TsaE [Armatimonadetes bacterium]|nr:tRNA (adenosine(37)-N6)-threonylcarbamoyltransferase complex ATPase subunit type 1 TsaE [Armatimonadota bacterium]